MDLLKVFNLNIFLYLQKTKGIIHFFIKQEFKILSHFFNQFLNNYILNNFILYIIEHF